VIANVECLPGFHACVLKCSLEHVWRGFRSVVVSFQMAFEQMGMSSYIEISIAVRQSNQSVRLFKLCHDVGNIFKQG